ncbi:MAG TPA: hypothetical protein VGV14_17410, partial [Rhodanobacter sp.]|nr:hypothetical protein [Rhodanobacter sp.]
MRNEATISSSIDSASTHACPSTRGSKNDKPGATHDHENVQRFRKLMDGKGSGRADASETETVADTSGGMGKKLSLQQDQALRELLQRQ